MLNRKAYVQLIEEDVEELKKLPKSLERTHIEVVLRSSIISYYGELEEDMVPHAKYRP